MLLKLPRGVYAKDVILYLAGQLGANGANYQALEFHGSGITNLSVEGRMTITNMVIELGAKFGIMPCDEKLRTYLNGRVEPPIEGVEADKDASYCRTVEVDLDTLKPQVAKPHKVDNVSPVEEVEGIPVQHAIIGTCTNGRLEDLAVAANILKDRTIAPGMTLIIAPASRSVYIEAIQRGYIETFLKAGASVAIPGCSACSGGSYVGIPADGESVITTANRNFKGRLGNPNSYLYLASPATVACSALTGRIEDSRKLYYFIKEQIKNSRPQRTGSAHYGRYSSWFCKRASPRRFDRRWRKLRLRVIARDSAARDKRHWHFGRSGKIIRANLLSELYQHWTASYHLQH